MEPQQYETITVMVAGMPQFAELAARSSPLQTVLMMNDITILLDEIICDLDLYKAC